MRSRPTLILIEDTYSHDNKLLRCFGVNSKFQQQGVLKIFFLWGGDVEVAGLDGWDLYLLDSFAMICLLYFIE